MVLVKHRFELLLAFLFLGVVLAFVVPLVIYSEDPYEIRPDPLPDSVPLRAGPREPVIRAGDRPPTYNPLDDM